MSADASVMNCLTCGYDLRALAVRRCPECGSVFDPGDARTFRKGGSRTATEGARRIAMISGVVPLVTIGLLNLVWITARLELGRWPEPQVDRISRIGGVMDVVLPAAGISFVLAAPALLVCIVAGCFAAAASAVTRRDVRRSFGTLAASNALAIGAVAYAVFDPRGILHGLFWDM